MSSREEITVKAAGRKGGTTTRDRYGREFYQRIGKLGGERTRELYAELLREFGKRGGRPRRPSLDEYMGEEVNIERG
jgi:hypothetical protein